MTLTEVLTFCATATAVERNAIMSAITAGGSRQTTRQATAAVTLSQIKNGDAVNFIYDSVKYDAIVQKINRTTATVKITQMAGTPRRNIFVGTVIRVSAGLLAKSMSAGA